MTDNKYIGVQGLEELIALTKNNLAKKADTLQFDVMPDPVKYTGKVVQYVGVSDVSYTRSHFYYSDGTRWTEETISDELYRFKGSCLTADLPSEGNAVGDTWNLEDDSSYGPAGTNVAWTGTEWDALSGDMNYMRGLHDPDWSGVRSSGGNIANTASGYHSIFTCPARGNLTICIQGDLSFVEINSIYSVALLPNRVDSPTKFITTPVNKGDIFGITNDNSANIKYYCIFVPYKVQ